MHYNYLRKVLTLRKPTVRVDNNIHSRNHNQSHFGSVPCKMCIYEDFFFVNLKQILNKYVPRIDLICKMTTYITLASATLNLVAW